MSAPEREHWAWRLFVEFGEIFGKFLFRPELMEKGVEQARQLKAIFDRFGVPEEGRVLDLCCGVGRHAIPLAELGYHVTGVDISPIYIEKARARAAEKGLTNKTHFLRGDVRELEVVLADEGPFDAVICLGTSIGYFGEEGDRQMFSGARRMAREGALLVVSAVNRDWIMASFRATAVMTAGAWELHSFREFDFTSSTLKVRYRFCEREGSVLAVKGEVETALRLYAPHELWRLVEASGWRPLSLHASLTLEPLAPSSSTIVLLAKASSASSEKKPREPIEHTGTGPGERRCMRQNAGWPSPT